ncbi:alpha/beta hydrolase family protein [Paenibacillus peoriae]|uniref:alpha/beta hydrolase family protein n=1 Tax=Paenibacillus peoriae TaxID=59893 RepID=UPI001B7D8308|nr:prolyl oligopeptidase family serine peptidase [Paenibacillus peoriae]
MKKLVGRIGFIILCVVVFIISASISFAFYLNAKVTEPYKYLEVDRSSYGEVIYDLPSDGKDTTKYDLYLPKNVDKNKNYSLIFYIHGGGFTGGDKADGKYWGPYYTSKGMVVVSVNYTLSKGDGVANLNTMYDELRNTMQVVIDDCANRGYRITEAATTGGSAGGTLAMLMAYKEPETLPVPVKFVFEQTGPALFEPDFWGQTEDDGRAMFVSMMTGYNFTAQDIGSNKYMQTIKEISPALLVNENTVPTILGYGPKDTVVPPSIKFKLLEALSIYNVEHTYIEFENSGHGLLNDIDKSEEFYKKTDAYIEKYFENH